MRIDRYSFGKIIVDGSPYTTDVIIYPDRVDASWWRKEGHRLHLDDLAAVLQQKPEIIVIGTGFFGFMKVPDDVVRFLHETGIRVEIARTISAVNTYNSVSGTHRTFACFHLTC